MTKMTEEQFNKEIKGLKFRGVEITEIKTFTKCKHIYSSTTGCLELFSYWDNNGFEGKSSWYNVKNFFDHGHLVFVLDSKQVRYLKKVLNWYNDNFIDFNQSNQFKIITCILEKGIYTWDERELIHSLIQTNNPYERDLLNAGIIYKEQYEI